LQRDHRSAERVLAHYELERELADRLRCAPADARPRMYTEVYRELFASLPDHPQHRSLPQTSDHADGQFRRIASRLQPGCVFLEIGCADAALGFAAARRAGTVYGLDVTDAVVDVAKAPPNFRFLPTDGVEIPLPAGEVDVAYSHQVMEHLHPDDAAEQLAEIHRVLKIGGLYICITPSRVSGPHDVSCYFDYEATGLHLKEYDYGILRAMFRRAGFRKISGVVSRRGYEIRLPDFAIRAAERGLLTLPLHLRASVTSLGPVQVILGLTVLAVK
jgi:SAM-dependent methyltransferase